MANPFKARGWKGHREEEEKRKKQAEQRKGKLWRFFITDKDEDDIPIRFLTNEPILYYEHTFKIQGKIAYAVCTGEDCEHCADGNKPSYKGAFLIVDRRSFEIDERDTNGNKTGKKKKVKDRLKLLVRGTTDLAKLDRQNTKHGLTNRDYYVTKVGSGTSTSYEFERGDEEPLSQTEIKNLLAQLPEKYRNMDVYEIVEAQIFDDDGVSVDADEDEENLEEAKEKINKGVQKLGKSSNASPAKPLKTLTKTPSKPSANAPKKLKKL